MRRQNNEEGLLGLAFHPGYAENRRLFLYFSASSPLRNVVAEARATPDGERVDLTTLKPILDLDKPYGNHIGGAMVFGPDGMLYVGVGDGGSGGDPHQNGQNLGSLLGKILRLDVDGDDFPADATRNYAIPPTNPLVGITGDDEIWFYGLRNPWRDSFDRLTGQMYIADVGQGAIEEVDVAGAGVGSTQQVWEVGSARH